VSDDLIAQLRAGLDEDERVASAVAAIPPGSYGEDSPEKAIVTEFLNRAGHHARMLRWVKAAREILGLHGPVEQPAVYSGDSACRGCGFDSREEFMVDPWTDCPVLRALASVYGDTPTCTCPGVDVRTLNDPADVVRTVKGLDLRCPEHGEGAAR
jgi:hypothetical protein